MHHQDLKSLIHILKDGENHFSIPIYSDEKKELGSLVLIDKNLVNDQIIIDALTRWRQKYMKFFLTQFNATSDRTKSWLSQTIIPAYDRLFFLIYDDQKQLIGNFGLCNISSTQVELDNLIRGEKGGDTRLIYYSEIALLSWVYLSLDVPRANLHVFSNNLKTISLHESVGFNIERSHRLTRIMHNGEVRY